jgi:hypothetical protein
MLGEPTGLELWYQVLFSGPLSSPSGIYRIDLDNAVQERLTSTMYFNGQSVVGAADGNGLHLYGSGDEAFHVDRTGAVRHGPHLNGDVVSSDREGYWLQTDAESSSNGLALTLEHHRFDGSLIASVPAPPNAYIQSGGGEAMFLLRGADARSYLFDAVANEVSPLPGSVSAAAGGSVVTVRCSEKLDCPTVFIGKDGVESLVSDVVAGAGYFGPFGPFGRSQQISPDGAWVIRPAFPDFLTDYNGTDPVLLFALNPRSGERIGLGHVSFDAFANQQGAATWSPDRRWAFVATIEGIAAWRPGLVVPIVIPIGEGRAVVSALAVGSAPSAATA